MGQQCWFGPQVLFDQPFLFLYRSILASEAAETLMILSRHASPQILRPLLPGLFQSPSSCHSTCSLVGCSLPLESPIHTFVALDMRSLHLYGHSKAVHFMFLMVFSTQLSGKLYVLLASSSKHEVSAPEYPS